MKKLFASLLAATMVAGMAVSAFAYDATTGQDGTVAAKKDNDYFFGTTLYTKNGTPITKKNFNNDEKIYIPILSKLNVVDEDKAEDTTVALTKYSEVEKLSVRVKDVRNGKYVKNAKIVAKDLDGEKAATPAIYKITADAAADDTIGAYTGDYTEIERIDGQAKQAAELKYDLKDFVCANNDYVRVTLDGITKDVKVTTASQIADSLKSSFAPHFENNSTQTDKILLIKESSGKETDLTAANAPKLRIENLTTVGEIKTIAPTVTTPGKAERKASVTLKANKPGAGVDAPVYGNSPAGKVAQVEPGKNAVKGLPKMYFAELKVDDYFLADEDEFEFDLELKNGGSKEDIQSYEWTIGKDIKDSPINKGHDTIKINLDVEGRDKAVKFDKDIKNILLTAKDFEYEVKAAEQGDVYLDYNTGITKDIVVANPDADLEFLTFNGTPEFDFTGTLKYFVSDDTKEWYMYEIVDGKPVATNAKYNKEDSCFELRTSKLTKYVLSDKALVLGAEEKPADKPAEEKPAETDKVVGTGALA